MRPIAFCDRCRGIEVGWNRKYLKHGLVCGGWLSKSFRMLIYTAATAIFISTFPTTAAVVESNLILSTDAGPASGAEGDLAPIPDPVVDAIEEHLRRHARVSQDERFRIARAVVTSAKKHDVDPFLVASVLLVESSANPFAISAKGAVGIMQIHVPTWGALVDSEQINLFRVEDNVDLGTRILKDYISRHGLWTGLTRYLGASEPTEETHAYVKRIQDLYSDRLAD